jgi:hypothetical protein
MLLSNELGCFPMIHQNPGKLQSLKILFFLVVLDALHRFTAFLLAPFDRSHASSLWAH